MKKITTHLALLFSFFLWTCEDKVKISNLASIQIIGDDSLFKIGQSSYFYARGFDKNNNRIDKIDVAWSSSDESVITIDNEGKATAVSKGTADLIASSSDVTALKEIVVSTSRRKVLSEMFTSST